MNPVSLISLAPTRSASVRLSPSRDCTWGPQGQGVGSGGGGVKMMVKSVGDRQISPSESYRSRKEYYQGSKTPLTPRPAEPRIAPAGRGPPRSPSGARGSSSPPPRSRAAGLYRRGRTVIRHYYMFLLYGLSKREWGRKNDRRPSSKPAATLAYAPGGGGRNGGDGHRAA
jgi:hypothetical protein